MVYSSDINDAELFDAEPRLLVIDAELRLSFSEKKRARDETLDKRVRAELRL